MIISSLLDRESLKISSRLKVLWTPVNAEFESFIKILDIDILYINQTYYGNNIPNIIICNNKIEFYNECYSISRRLHLPVLIVDHISKNPLYDNNKIKFMHRFPCSHHVCISKKVSDSWDLKDVQILPYNSKDKDNIQIWKNLIFQVSKKIFKI